MFDIRDYGAKPDGVTDNTAMIQAAINACAGTGGGTVLISGGPYLAPTPSAIRKSPTIRTGSQPTPHV